MKKRLVSLTLVLCLLCSLVPALSLRSEAASSASAPSATAAQIDALFTARSKGQHPRILANNEDFSRVRKLIQTDPYMRVWYERIYHYCVEQLTEPVSKYTLSNNKLLNVSRVASHRITWMAFLYQVSGERRFAERAVEEMLAVCAFKDWHPDHYLDVGQMAYGVGLGYDWLYHYLTESQRSTIAKALYNYAIVTSASGLLSYEQSITNWNPWCHAGVSIAALAIYENYASACSTYLSGAVTNVQMGITRFTPMGCYAEGPEYFQICGGFMILFFETLFSTLGTDFGLSQLDGIRESGNYLLAVNGETGAFNHGDGDAVVVGGAMLHWYAKQFHMPQLSYFQRQIQNTSVLYDEILALLWYDPQLLENYSPTDQQLDYLLYSDVSESIASFRSFPGSAQQIYAAIKSGYNSSNHTDLDIGTFVMDAMGERWFEDLGSDSYSLPDYGGGYASSSGYDTDALRWNYYRKRAEGQNTLVINPDATGGQTVTAKCQITDYQSSYNGGFAKVNMLNAYKAYKATAANRALMLFDNRSRVLLRDEITCSASSKIYWFAHTKAAVTLSSDKKTAELTLNGKTLLAQICSPSTAKFSLMNATALSTSPKPTGELSRDEYRKLCISLSGVTSANIAVVFTPIVEESDRDKYLPTGGISVFSSFLSGKDPAVELTANAEGVYEIYTAEQLHAFSKAVNGGDTFAGKTVRLMNDIDLTGRSFTPIGGVGGEGVFKGTFDGGKHCIKNLFVFERSASSVGFFGKAGGATIKDLGIESGIVFGGKASAGLVGAGSSVTISGCYNRATVISTAGNSGGIVGQLGGTSKISNCYNHANIRSTDGGAGGIVGYISSATTTEILSCYHVGTLTDGLGKIGLIGSYNTVTESLLIKHITVKNCFSTASIKSSTVTNNSTLESYSGNKKVSAAQLMDSLPSDAFMYDCEWENGGYPVFTWQCDTVLPEDLVLNTEAELRLLAYTVNSGKDDFTGKTVKLGQNIDLDSREWIPIGGSETENSTSRSFRGTFDGQGYGIGNLSVTTGNYYAGFFGAMRGTVRNFGILSGRVVGNYKTGALVGSFSGTMENCFSRASISGTGQTGGLIGMSGKLTMSNCYCSGSVSASTSAGGLVGFLSSSASNTVMKNSYSSATLSGSTKGSLAASISTSALSVTMSNCHGISSYSLVPSGSTCTLSGCTALAAADLKAASATLGTDFYGDSLYPQNGGYPLLQVFAYGVELPTLTPNEQGVYEISTAQELRALARAVNVDANTFAGKTVRLMEDIDLELREWMPIGTDRSFAGTFDGNGHCIQNLCVTSGNNYVGLFGRLAGATVENLGIESGTVMGTGKVSALAGSIRNGTVIRGCYNRATVSGRTIVGGLVGMVGPTNCLVESCYNAGSVSAYSSVGGVIGYLAGDTTNFTVKNCYEGSASGLGLLGVSHASVTTAKMENCYAIDTGSLVGTQNSLVITGSGTLTAAQLQGKAAEMGTAFAEDYLTKNQLYPVLQWENAQASTSFQERDGVYLIQSEADLRLLAYFVGKGERFQGQQFLLTTDLDLGFRPWLPIGGTYASGTIYFKGSFNGGGHKIHNLNVRTQGNHGGLFGMVSDGVIENLGIESGTVLAKQYAGGLVARAYANATIRSCYNKAAVYAGSNSGGLIGRLNSSNITVENCYNTGVVTAKTIGSSTGGFVGILSTGIENTWLRNCYNVGNRYGLVSTGGTDMVNSGAENCYSTGSLRLYKTANSMILKSCTQVSDEGMKTLVPTLGQAFTADAEGINRGYPILTWELGGPKVDESIVIKHTLNLASDISINYAVEAALLKDYDSFYLQCELYDGRSMQIQPVLTGSYYYFTLEGFAAINMNDTVSATLHMTKGGREFLSREDRYSVAQYAYSQLNKEGASTTLKALCADLLRYGSAAQSFKGYRTDSLADAAMTEANRTFLSDLNAVTFGNNNVTLNDLDAPTVTWAGKALNLESKVALKYVIDTSAYKGDLKDLSLRLSYVDYLGQTQTAVVSELEVYGAGENRYAFSFDGLLAAELRSVVSAAVYSGDAQVSPTLRYSADTYGNNRTGQLLTLCKALFAYSDTALQFFRSN